jgi:hypothetical protein
MSGLQDAGCKVKKKKRGNKILGDKNPQIMKNPVKMGEKSRNPESEAPRRSQKPGKTA